MSIADELLRIAEEARRVRQRLDGLAQSCAELREQLSGSADRPGDGPADQVERPLDGDDTNGSKQDAPRKLQSVS